VEHDLFRKPLHTFRDHALGTATAMTHIAIAEAQDGKNADWIV
jgi:hypothetical protein